MLTMRTTVPLCLWGVWLWTAVSPTPLTAADPPADASKKNYDQWRMALSKDGVTNPVELNLPPGYEIDIVRIAEPNEGSWINLAFDPKGRLIISREDKGLLRFTLADDQKSVAKVETIEDTLLECRGILFAHDSLYLSANNSKGLYRLRDTDGDDTYDEVKLLKTLEGGVGHGRNCLALGPDGKIYLACGNNVKVPDDVSEKSPYRNYGLDRLLPCVWNEFLFDAGVVPPAGFVIRTDAEGKEWELFAGGFRNEYGLAFNPEGELFTYDADMEWDEGAPWYRPTCVMHVVSGGEYGWRQGTNVWPEFFADSLPRVVDVGLGSPTAIQFGTKSHFPRKYRDALFILDWSYGRIIAVHLTPEGASYKGKIETFIKGKPLNVTGLEFGPDGAMYFTVGGRRTQSALYRVRYVGEADTTLATPEGDVTKELRSIRRKIELSLENPSRAEIKTLWKGLEHEDRWINTLARIAWEQFPLDSWANVTFMSPATQWSQMLAGSRTAKQADQERLLFSCKFQLNTKSLDKRLIGLRTLQLTFIRLGKVRPESSDARTEVMASLSTQYPATTFPENYLLCELLVYLKSPDVIEKTLTLHDAAGNQQEKLFYLFTLRHMAEGWTLDQRRQLLRGLKEAEEFEGAQYMQRFVAFIRTDHLNTFTPSEQDALATEIAQLGHTTSGDISAQPRPLVKTWTMDELAPLLDQVTEKRNRQRGKELFAGALCAQCHRREQLGRPVGPDLDSAVAKFSRKDLLETIVAPSKVVDEKYRQWMIETEDGRVVTGDLIGGDTETLSLAPTPLEPTRMIRVRRNEIVSRSTSPLSLMPEGLLNSLTQDEILDLLAFLEFGTAQEPRP